LQGGEGRPIVTLLQVKLSGVLKNVIGFRPEPRLKSRPSDERGDDTADRLRHWAVPSGVRGVVRTNHSRALREQARERIAFTLGVSPEAVKVERCTFRPSGSILYCLGSSMSTRFFAKVWLADLYHLEPRPLAGVGEAIPRDTQVRSAEEQMKIEWNISNHLRALGGPAHVPAPISESYSARTIVWEQVDGMRLDRFVAWSRVTDPKAHATRTALLSAGAWLRKVHDSVPQGEEELDISGLLETIPNLARGASSSKYVRVAIRLLQRAAAMLGGTGKLLVPAGLTHGDFCLPNLMWDARLARLVVVDFEHFGYGNICHDLTAILFSLRGCFLNPLIAKRVVASSEESFWAGYGPMAREMFACIDALASSRIFYDLLPRLTTRRERRGWLGGVTASMYRTFLEDYVITRRLGIPAGFGAGDLLPCPPESPGRPF